MTDGDADGNGPDRDGPHALVPRPLTDESDVAVDVVRDAVRVARGEMSDVAFYEKYRDELEDGESANEEGDDNRVDR